MTGRFITLGSLLKLIGDSVDIDAVARADRSVVLCHTWHGTEGVELIFSDGNVQ